jgi:hypothetical protein
MARGTGTCQKSRWGMVGWGTGTSTAVEGRLPGALRGACRAGPFRAVPLRAGPVRGVPVADTRLPVERVDVDRVEVVRFVVGLAGVCRALMLFALARLPVVCPPVRPPTRLVGRFAERFVARLVVSAIAVPLRVTSLRGRLVTL